MGKVFESFDRGFGGAEIGISLRESHFDVLSDGTLFRHLLPFPEHIRRKLFVLEARQHMPLSLHLRRSDSASKLFPFPVEFKVAEKWRRKSEVAPGFRGSEGSLKSVASSRVDPQGNCKRRLYP